MHGILGEGGGDGRIEGCGAMGIEQFGESPGEGAQMHAAHRGELQEPHGARGRVVQPVSRPMGSPCTFVGLERLDVAGLLDLRAAIVAPRVRGDERAAIEDAYGLDGGEHLEGAAHVGVRDGVVVQVKAYLGGLVGVHDDPLGSRERLIGQGEQMPPLGLEALAHRAAAILRAGYKTHVSVDRKTKLVLEERATAANVHDSQVLDELLGVPKTRGRDVWADSAYRSAEQQQRLRRHGFCSHVHERAYRGRPLTGAQQRKNRRKSRVRVRVEHVFATMTQMGGMTVRTIGIERMQVWSTMKAPSYNLKRLEVLIRLRKIPIDGIGVPAL